MSMSAIVVERSRPELRQFARQRAQMAVTFGMPVLLPVLLGVIGGGTCGARTCPRADCTRPG